MPVASGHLIFYLDRVASGVGLQPPLLRSVYYPGFRKDDYEGYR